MIDFKYDNINDIKVDVIKAYVGKNASSYIVKWEKIYFGHSLIQINWYALFFFFFWYGYRKMNGYFLLLLILAFLLNLIPTFRNSIYFQCITIIFFSGLSYILYFLKLENIIKKAQKENIAEEHLINYVAQKGGVSNIGGVINIFITVCWIVFIYYFLKYNVSVL